MTIAEEIKTMMAGSSWIRKMFEEGARLKAEFGADRVFVIKEKKPAAWLEFGPAGAQPVDEPQPGRLGMGVDDGKDVRDELVGLPGLDRGGQLGHAEQHLTHELPRRGEVDVGGNAVTDTTVGEAGGDLLGQPAFDAPSGDGD